MKRLVFGVMALALISFTSCDSDDDNAVLPDGGTLSGGPYTFIVSDGEADNVSGVSLEGNVGTNSKFVVTDDLGNILGLPGDMTALQGVNFDGAGGGLCYIWHISYEDGLEGLVEGGNTEDILGSYDLSNAIEVNRNLATIGGTLSGGPYTFMVGDGIADNVSGITLEGNVGDNSGFIVTDAEGNIQGLPGDLTAVGGVNFDGAGGGLCYIWHISYQDGLTGLTAGANTSDLAGAEFSLSNAVEINRVAVVEGGTLSGGPFTFMVGDDVIDNVSGITLEGNLGANSRFIVTDAEGKILGLPGDITAVEGVNFDGAGEGLCYIWHISYEDGLEGLVVEGNTSDLVGDFSLSNQIEVNRVAAYSDLTLDISGLEDLGADFMYEGWVIVNGSPVTTGIFSVDGSGALSATTFSVKTTDLEAATAFVLSIEPTIDPDPAPAATKLLIGEFLNDEAMVSSNGIVTATDFTDSWGNYILATPTDSDATNELSGIWFLDNTNAPTLATGLRLPTLEAGWKYEGWVVINGVPVSTGTFTDPSMADDNAATSPFKGGLNDGPPYPGEDYVMGSAAGLNFPTDLSGETVVISVEPSPDNSPAPFTLKPLAGMIPTDVTTGSLQTLQPGSGPVSVISGTVTR